LRTPDKDKITLRHLLTMSAGLEWHEIDTSYTDVANSEIRMDRAPDPYRYALEQAVVAPPGHVWNYNSGSSEVMGAVLKKATGKALDALARTLLFEPLGIADVEWFPYALGNPSAAAGLRLRPRDLAKIGQLVLQHGAWNGIQIVPRAWIEASTAPQISGPDGLSYGYQFWLGHAHVDGRTVGIGGQRVLIVPALDLMVVVNAGLYKSPLQVQTSVVTAIFDRFVLKAVASHP
jgi:CubicO group peptidase (beta-lactamase class C family)